MSTLDIIKFYLRHINGYKRYFFIFFITTIIISTETSLYGYARNILIDSLANKNLTFEYYVKPLIIFGGIILSYEICHLLKIWSKKRSLPYVNKEIMLNLYNNIQNKNYNFFKNNSSGSLTSRLRDVIGNYNDLIGDVSDAFITNPFKIASCLFLIFYINKNIAIIVSIFLVSFVCICSVILSKLGKVSCTAENNYNYLIGRINDRFLNMFTIFAFHSFKKESNILNRDLNANFVIWQEKIYKYELLFHFVGGTIYSLMFFAPIVYSIYLYVNSNITIGNVIGIWTYTTGIAVSIWDLLRSIQFIVEEVSELKSSLEVIWKIKNNTTEPRLTNRSIIQQLPTIEFKNVSFNYTDEKFILKNFNIKINGGEKIGIVGESGTGKSTIFNLLLKYNNNYTGKILIDNEDIRTINTEYLRNNISIIPQETILFNRSVMDNIKYGNDNISDSEVYNICKKILIHNSIIKLKNGYNTPVGEIGSKLSGGQRQRISIARAFIKKSKILLLDEPTSALDAITEKYFQDSLNYLISNLKCTTIVIAHKLLTLVDMDKIIVVSNGNIVDVGTHEELIKNKDSYYKKLWDIQTGKVD